MSARSLRRLLLALTLLALGCSTSGEAGPGTDDTFSGLVEVTQDTLRPDLPLPGRDTPEGEDAAAPSEDTAGSADVMLTLTPAELDFGTVASGQSASRATTVRNAGSAPAIVDRLLLVDATGFSVRLPGVQLVADGGDGRFTLDPRLTIDPGKSVEITVTYEAESEHPITGELRLHSNAAEEWTVATLRAGAGGAEVDARPSPIVFGGQPVGRAAKMPLAIRSVGEEPLRVDAISLGDATDRAFSLDRLALETLPVTLAPGEEGQIRILYQPGSVSPTDPGTGEPTLDRGTVVIESNGRPATLTVPISGFGIAAE